MWSWHSFVPIRSSGAHIVPQSWSVYGKRITLLYRCVRQSLSIQEGQCWKGACRLPGEVHACALSRFSHVWLCDLWTVAYQAPLSRNSPGRNTGVGYHALLQESFLTQGLNPCLLHLLHFKQTLLTEPPRKPFLVRYLLLKSNSAGKAQLWMAISLFPQQSGSGCLTACKGSNSMAPAPST